MNWLRRKQKRKHLSVEDIQAALDAVAERREREKHQRIETTFQRILHKINEGKYKIDYKGRLEVSVRSDIELYSDRTELQSKFNDTALELVDDTDGEWSHLYFLRLR